jgi:hypothetical protein
VTYEPNILTVAREAAWSASVDTTTERATAIHMLPLNGWIGTIHPGNSFGLGNTVVRDVLKYTELKYFSITVNCSIVIQQI